MSVTSIHSGMPAAAVKSAANALPKGIFGPKGTDWFALSGLDLSALFGTQVASLLSGTGVSAQPPAVATSAPVSDPQATLAQYVRNGMPLSTIANSIAQRVSASVRSLLAGKVQPNALDRMTSTMTQTLMQALAPPGTAPPGIAPPENASDQVAALANRLTALVNELARGTNGAGQQNEIAGSLLDAKSAKEPPAQQKTNDASSTLDASSLVRSLMASAATALQSQATNAPLHTAQPVLPSPAGHPPLQNGLAMVDTGRLAAGVGAPTITIANAPDLLARMIVRASGADQAINGNLPASATLPANSRGAQTPAAIAERFAAAIASVVADASASGTSDANAGGNSFGHDRNSELFGQTSTAPTTSATANVNAASAAAVSPMHLQTLVQHMSEAQAAQARTDANALIAQIVKGMVMRTNAQGDSQMRLRLQPANLGDVTMKITVQGSQISASVIAQNADVKSALLENQHHLAQSLAQAGLNLAGFSVDVSGGDAGREQNRDRTAGFGRRYTVHEVPGAAQNEPATLAANGPPLVSGNGLELFNYLA